MRLAKSLVAGMLALGGAATCLAQNPYYADYWNEYTRRYERAYHPRYDAPPVLYYGHAPPPPEYGEKRPVGDGMRFRRMPPDWGNPGAPVYYGRSHDDGPSIAPYYRGGRSAYGGIRYGWW